MCSKCVIVSARPCIKVCVMDDSLSNGGFICFTDIDECADLMACENAKYECMNRPGSFECLCRYKNSKNADGCGMHSFSHSVVETCAVGIVKV